MTRDELAAQVLASCQAVCTARGWPLPQPQIEWNVRGMHGGWAHEVGNRLRLNPEIAEAEGAAYASTIAHEYAHLVAFALIKRGYSRHEYGGHGEGWRWIMRSFGYPPERCHEYHSARPARDSLIYTCACAGKQYFVKKPGRYHCRKCKHSLQLVGKYSRSDELLKELGDA